jgi:hypothetical protein
MDPLRQENREYLAAQGRRRTARQNLISAWQRVDKLDADVLLQRVVGELRKASGAHFFLSRERVLDLLS